MSEPTKLDLRCEKEKLLAMELHETYQIDKYCDVLCVIGGWIYEIYDGDNAMSSVFVPFGEL